MKTRFMFYILFPLLVVGLVQASIVINPVGWTNQGGTIDYNFDPVIDNSGLSYPLNTGDTVPSILPTHIVPGGDEVFENVAGRFTNTDSGTATLTFDLGGSYNINGCIFWNGAEVWGGVYYNERGIDEMTLSFSTDGTTFIGDIVVTPSIIPDGPDPFDAETFSFSNILATHVRLSNFSNGIDNNLHTAISEIRFTASTNEAGSPAPADGAVNVPITTDNLPLDDTNTTLSWVPSPEYTDAAFNVYFGTAEPNELLPNYGLTWLNQTNPKMTTTFIDPSPTGDLSNDVTYYWVVDSYEPNLPASDILHKGSHWSFTTVPTVPIILTQPVSQTVAIGDNVEFSVVGLNIVSYQWYKGDLKLTGETSETLMITNIQLADEGFFHCVVSNGNPVDDVASDSARLLTERLMAKWDFDGDLVDEVEGIAGFYSDPDPQNPDPPETYSTDSVAGSRSFSFGDEPYFVEVETPEYFDFFSRGLTVSAWIKVTERPVEWDTYISKGGSYWLNVESSWYAGVGSNGWTWSIEPVLEDNDWHLTTAAYDPQEGVIKYYVDGKLNNEFADTPVLSTEPLIFGAADATGRGRYYGLLDEVQIYSYALSPLEIAQYYVDIEPAGSVCIDRTGLEFDLSGPAGEPDCEVNLYDLAEFATAWLNCNRVAGADSGLVDCL